MVSKNFSSHGEHTPSIPYWPRSNGKVERFMPNLSKIIRHSYDSKTDWKDTLLLNYLNYRNCIHLATDEKPPTLFYSERSLRIVYNDDTSSFDELLRKDNSVSIHNRNIQKLAIEMYKAKNNLSPQIT